MIKDILNKAGLRHRRGRFIGDTSSTYAVYMDDLTTDGPDGLPWIIRHDITVELYESKPDDATEQALEAAITEAGLQWTKQDRYWLQTEQQYQVLYTFTYYEKRRA